MVKQNKQPSRWGCATSCTWRAWRPSLWWVAGGGWGGWTLSSGQLNELIWSAAVWLSSTWPAGLAAPCRLTVVCSAESTGRMDEWFDGWMDGWMNKWMDWQGRGLSTLSRGSSILPTLTFIICILLILKGQLPALSPSSGSCWKWRHEKSQKMKKSQDERVY